jgi:hypothetical protein
VLCCAHLGDCDLVRQEAVLLGCCCAAIVLLRSPAAHVASVPNVAEYAQAQPYYSCSRCVVLSYNPSLTCATLRPCALIGSVMKTVVNTLLARGFRRPGMVYSSSVTELP